jgi:hypothetical protein
MRSGIPKVIGILMIIFASLGLLFGMAGLLMRGVNQELFDGIAEFHRLQQFTLVFGLIGLGVSALHLVTGLSAVRYRRSAPRLTLLYGCLNITQAIANAIVTFVWLKPALDAAMERTMVHTHGPDMSGLVGASMVFGLMISISWPIIAIVLMTRPAVTAACTN